MRSFQSGRFWGCLMLGVLLAGGCGPPLLRVRPVEYSVEVGLDPTGHRLAGRSEVQVEPLDPSPSPPKRARLRLYLHPGLELDSIEIGGTPVTPRKTTPGRTDDDERGFTPTVHTLLLEEPGPQLTLTLSYAGTLFQDVAAGEEQGQIHNFAMRAHVAEDGVYLEPSGYWYPRFDLPDEVDPELTLSAFELSVDPVDDFELVAGLERQASDDERLHWTSPFPLEGLVLLGGPLVRHSRSHGEIELHAVLAPGKDEVAGDILDAAGEYLDQYQTLIGPYPFSEFTVLEAFFSSGFAFPTCTQIVGSQLSEYKQYRRHGYLDHELLHNWWGNGVLVDPRDGNWCEGLASYAGNYYGHVLDGDEQAARKQRRNQSNFLSSIAQENDKPLGTFGIDDGAGRGVGYQKGAAVFHMLGQRIGDDALFAGLRRLTAEQMGRFASWDVLQEAFEQESGEDLESFFSQWVRRGGAPLLELIAADWQPGATQVALTISQGETDFELDVPLRLHYGSRSEDVVVRVVQTIDRVEVPCEPQGLTAVEIDPDYHVFRKLKPEETMPTSSLTKRGDQLLIVTDSTDEELAEGYRVVIESYERAVAGDADSAKPEGEVLRRRTDGLEEADFAGASVLILGDAVRDPQVVRFLARTRSPVQWTADGFALEDEDYSEPGQAVFLTVHHPDDATRGVTVYHGNAPAALANARVLGYYPNSLLVFETPIDDDAGSEVPEGMPRSKVIQRVDFEFHDRIDF